MAKQLAVYVALLRGINVGGHTLVSMAALKEGFVALGYGQVQTYINSGNVIFSATSLDPRTLERDIEKMLASRFGFPVRVVVRSFQEMTALVGQLPARWQTASDERHNVIFLHYSVDDPESLQGLTAKPGIEELQYHPGVLFWSAKTSNLTKSNMLKVNRLPIYKAMTVRNLNTTLKVYDLMRQAAEASAS